MGTDSTIPGTLLPAHAFGGGQLVRIEEGSDSWAGRAEAEPGLVVIWQLGCQLVDCPGTKY